MSPCILYTLLYTHSVRIGKEENPYQKISKKCFRDRVGEDTFEMCRRYRYRYTRGCIFCIFRYCM